MGLFELLTEVYQRYGFYKERLISITKKGKAGADEIVEMMKNLRSNPPKSLAGSDVVKVLDFNEGTEINPSTGQKGQLEGFPKSNVLQFFTKDGSKVSARPSGTEPKIKFYFSVKEPLKETAAFDSTLKLLENKIDKIIEDLKLQ
jgi:phosphoglucomutase